MTAILVLLLCLSLDCDRLLKTAGRHFTHHCVQLVGRIYAVNQTARPAETIAPVHPAH